MSIDVVSPLLQRMIEDMIARKLGPGTQEPLSTMPNVRWAPTPATCTDQDSLLKDEPRSLQRER